MSAAEFLNQHYPKLSEYELAVAVEACKQAGAVNAAIALSKHITRLTIELDLANKCESNQPQSET